MNDPLKYSPIEGISLERLIEFLQMQPDWKLVETSSRFHVFESKNDDAGNPIELALPVSKLTSDLRSRIQDAVQLLAIVRGEDPLSIVQEVLAIDRDVLMERLPVESVARIPLRMAALAVENLKNLISFGAALEVDSTLDKAPKTKESDILLNKCQFGHTFKSSFGFTLEMPIPLKPRDHTGRIIQTAKAPIERRVMERIVRGFKTTQAAVRDDNPDLLVQSYSTGFNSSMLSELLEFKQTFPETTPRVTVKWAPRQEVHEDAKIAVDLSIAKNDTQLKRTADVLSTAIRELRYSEDAAIVEIIGLAQALKKSMDPDKLVGNDDEGITRLVTIAGREVKSAKEVRIQVKLTHEDYSKACDAHKLGQRVSLKGRLVKNGNRTSLVSPHDFKVV